MTDDLQARAALAQLLEHQLADYWHDVDANWGRNAGAHYTDDADFIGEAATYSGRAKIQEFYAWRVAQGARLAVHAINNFRVETLEGNRAHVTWYCLLYAANGVPILPSNPPITISLVSDDYERQADGRWLCSRRQWKTLFQGGAPAHNPKL
jgi:hypothetical protein